MKNIQISPRLAAAAVTVVLTSITLFEWKALYALDHPKPERINCVSCHSDAKTLKAMADKAGDDLYIVKRGDMSQADYARIMARHTSTASK